MAHPHAVYFSPDAAAPPEFLRGWCDSRALAIVVCRSLDDLMAMALRGRPDAAIFDARTQQDVSLAACRRLKGDPYTGVVPGGVLAADGGAALAAAFQAGADEVLVPNMPSDEAVLRLDVMLRRADRDVHVHPSTRLPGAPEIEAEIGRRLAAGEKFAACYADLDHFKEYNDRYSYYEGDRVIRILAKILHDVVRGYCPEDGFVGHIGGDDFIFIVPVRSAPEICQEIVSIFDALVPCQYSEQDRHAGYFFGKDRRGQLHRVPLMTVSIGVVTNERRTFGHPAQVSELATEMKSYAKTLPGSVYVVDRRHDPIVGAPVGASER
ncbi:MAG TPA: GGDEF domain-containing protein [Gemmatimonadaceae bacterium]|nr:GGDEF domain-containing protein [Gemmatimonadaceae bacterium]